MRYGLRCANCRHEWEVICPAEEHEAKVATASCPHGCPGKVDQLVGDVKVFGVGFRPYFDRGLGVKIASSTDKDRVMKDMGVMPLED